MRTILDSVSGLLTGNSNVESDSVRARFLGFGASSLEVEIFAYVFARDWPHFLALQGELLLQIMEAVESAGAEIAFPSQTMYLEPSGQQALLEAAPSK
jgi:MscS family membrane protein